MFNLVPLWVKGLVALALLAAAVLAYNRWVDSIGDEREAIVSQRYDAALAAQKLEAAGKLAVETAKAAAVTAAFAEFKNLQELKDAENKTTIHDLRRDLRTARMPSGGRLFDPNQAGCGDNRGITKTEAVPAASSGAANPAQAGGLLSVQLTDLLDRLLFEADEVNVAYASCRATAVNDRSAFTLP